MPFNEPDRRLPYPTVVVSEYAIIIKFKNYRYENIFFVNLTKRNLSVAFVILQ